MSEGKPYIKAAIVGSFFLLIATLLTFLGTKVGGFFIGGSVLASQYPSEKVIGSNNEVNVPTNNTIKIGGCSTDEANMKQVELKIGDIGSFDHEGTSYTWKVMEDGKKWLSRNLNVRVDDSWCYNNDADNCAAYGRLYTWKALQKMLARSLAIIGDCPLMKTGKNLLLNMVVITIGKQDKILEILRKPIKL
jgi:hypothetical protein